MRSAAHHGALRSTELSSVGRVGWAATVEGSVERVASVKGL